jgi:hypothetical protein
MVDYSGLEELFHLPASEEVEVEEVVDEKKDISTPLPITHVLFHACVRNDYGCPNCQRFRLSFCTSVEDAAAKAFEDRKDYWTGDLKKSLIQDKSVWIDEWERRSNGDSYLILPLLHGEKYSPTRYSELLDSADGQDATCRSDAEVFVVLRVEIRHAKSCPDNIAYDVTFFATKQEATDAGVDLYKEDWHQDEEDDDDEQTASWLDEGFWIPLSGVSDHRGDGCFYRVLRAAAGESIRLNDASVCPQLDYQVWRESTR